MIKIIAFTLTRTLRGNKNAHLIGAVLCRGKSLLNYAEILTTVKSITVSIIVKVILLQI